VQQAATRLASLGLTVDEGPASGDTTETAAVEEAAVEEAAVEETAVEEDVTVDEIVATESSSTETETVIESETEETVSTAVDYSESSSESSASASDVVGNGPFIQLAAYKSEGRAEEGWQTFIGRYPDILDGLPHRVLQVDLGGDTGTVYRLQAGPMPAHSEAEAICSQLKQRNADCFLVSP
jgi:hypothetical protein